MFFENANLEFVNEYQLLQVLQAQNVACKYRYKK